MAEQVKAVFSDERCKGCGLCVEACPKKIVALSERLNERGMHPAEVVDIEKCIGCGFCAVMCPDCAVRIVEKV